MTYGALAWNQPYGLYGLGRDLAGRMPLLQNQCLQVITGAHRVTPVSTLEVETYIPPLNLYLGPLVARATQRLGNSGIAGKIEGAC